MAFAYTVLLPGTGNETIRIDGQGSEPNAIIIPATITDVTYGVLPVVAIGDSAFFGVDGITSLDISAAIYLTTIGNSAFAYSGFISGNLVIPNSVTSIGDYAFIICYTTDASTLTLGSGLRTIGNNAFDSCTSFGGNLVIPNSVISIGRYAFNYNSDFGTLTLGSGLMTIGDGAFRNCSGFTGDLVIPNSVTSIGNDAFQYCTSLAADAVTFLGNAPTAGTDVFLYSPPTTGTYEYGTTGWGATWSNLTMSEVDTVSSSSSSSSSSSIDSSSSSSSSSSSLDLRTWIYPNSAYRATEREERFAFFASNGDISTIVILGNSFIIQQNTSGQLVWDLGGNSQYTFFSANDNTQVAIENRQYTITYDGEGSLLFTLSYRDITHKTIPFVYEVEKTNPIWTMALYGENVYAGTGSEGILLKSKNRQFWSNIYRVDDVHIKALYVYNGKLYIGTAPNGKIYTMDLATDVITLSQEIGNEISAFSEFNGVIYAATSKPSQIYTYKLKDDRWDEFYKPYGNIVTDMLSHNGKMYVFMDASDFISYNGSHWNIEETTIDNVASVRRVTKEPFSHVNGDFVNREGVVNADGFEVENLLDIFPLNRSKGIRSVTVDGKSLTLGSSVNGRVYNYTIGS